MKAFLITLALWLTACAAPSEPAAVLYQDLEYGYQLDIPAGWTAKRDFADSALLLRPPIKQPSDNLYSLTVAMDESLLPKAGGDDELNAYVNYRLQRLQRYIAVEKIEDQSRRASAQGLPVWQGRYQYKIGPQSLKGSTWLLMSAHRGWAITATAPVDADPDKWAQLLAVQQSWQAVTEKAKPR